MSQYNGSRQQVLTMVLTASDQYGDTLTLKQLTPRLSVPISLHRYFSIKSELIRQLIRCILSRVKQPPPELFHRSLADELRDLLATYRKSFPTFSHTSLFDLKLYYSEGWSNSMELRENQWQRIAATLEAGIASGQLRPVNINLVRMMVDAMLLDPFLQEYLSLSEVVDILLLGIARAP